MKNTLALIIFFVLFSSVYGQNNKNSACSSMEYRQFDFWIGDWNVFDTLGNKIGENNILLLQDSCLIQENWKSQSESGTSYNFYDSNENTWNQIWVDNRGRILKLKGKYSKGKMIMRSAKVQNKSGDWYYNELSWTKKKDGSVLQTWIAVNAEGKKLFSIFKGIYKKEMKRTNKVVNQVGKVTGIGGIFFKSKDAAKIKKWYSNNLGFSTDQYGKLFASRDIDIPEKKAYLQWSPFAEDTEYFDPSNKDFMINYRVENIEELVKKLKANGVTILDKIEEYEYGKFVHILDPENNKIELWEPVDQVFTESQEGKTTK